MEEGESRSDRHRQGSELGQRRLPPNEKDFGHSGSRLKAQGSRLDSFLAECQTKACGFLPGMLAKTGLTNGQNKLAMVAVPVQRPSNDWPRAMTCHDFSTIHREVLLRGAIGFTIRTRSIVGFGGRVPPVGSRCLMLTQRKLIQHDLNSFRPRSVGSVTTASTRGNGLI